MKIEITLPESVSFTSRGVTFTLPMTELTAELISEAVVAGFSKAGVDAASSALSYMKDHNAEKDAVPITIEDATTILVEKRLTTWKGGSWGAVRGAGNGMNEMDRTLVSIVRPIVKGLHAPEYKNGDETARVALCVEYIATRSPDMLAHLNKHAETLIAAKVARAESDRALTAMLLPEVAVDF